MTEEPQKSVLMADDCFLATEALAESDAMAAFSCVLDGIALMNHLTKQPHSEARRLPDLILLDLNMPRKDGRQALLEIKSEPALQHIPVVILTTSEAQKDIEFTKKAGAESFITKPASFDEWVRIMKSLAENWLR